ncbi:MAG: zinc ribbon domain-containing protein [Dehalococcoidales bacterium]
MPIYEYVCTNCKKKFELLRSLSQADAGAICSDCHGEAKRILSTFAAVSRDSSGQSVPMGNSCSGCSSSSCTTCGS